MAGPDFLISDGLKGGEQVIVNGLQKARPGSVVKPVPWNPEAPVLAAPSAAPVSAPVVSKAEAKPEEKK
jgi:membrane fusion protein (multidrug efflux system)